MNKLLNFLSYHNAVPIALGILFLGAGGAFAASPEARDVVYSSEVVTQSVDNSRIVNADLDLYPFAVTVLAVNEDDTSYFVEYSLQTIQLVDGVWQDVTRLDTLSVSKDLLRGRDLGLYATKQLAELRDHERAKLKETQGIERGIGESQKIVATVYSGLVGALLDPTTESFPTYQPVIVESVGGSTDTGSVGDTTPPAVTLVGDNPARIYLNSVYEDLGVVATDNVGTPTITLKVDGADVSAIDLDTSRVWAYVISYTATDAAGNTSVVTRDVVVDGDAPAPAPTPEPEPEPESEVEPTPEPAATTTATTTP